MTVLRYYQNESLDAIEAAWDGGMQAPALVLATGLGKTVVMAELLRRAVRDYDRKPVVLVHRDELVRQTVDKLLAVDPTLLVGVVQGPRHEVAPEVDVVVASVQTLTGRLGTKSRKYVAPERFDLLLTDECHHAAAKSYLRIYDHFGGRTRGSGTLMLGVTATLQRGDGIGLGHVWQKVVYEFGAREGIEAGFLMPPVAYRVPVGDLDLGTVKTRHGDYADGELGKAMIPAGHRIAEAILEHGHRHDGSLRRGITFAPTIECAEEWCREFNEMGVLSRVVIGETPHQTRQAIYRATHEGLVDMIVSVMCLTEGFDLPSVEMAVIGRPTKNIPLYVQMIGRVLRPSFSTGKQNALILDVCGAMGKQAAICLTDLNLPLSCECSCDCTLGYICKATCSCPTGSEGHGADCEHHCKDFGKIMGEVEPKEDDETPDGELAFEEIDVFAGLRKSLMPRGRTPWLMTSGGIPFLPSTGSGHPTVFIWPEGDGNHTVGKLDGGMTRLGEHLPFPVAVQMALTAWGPKPAGLRGMASNGQLGVLLSNGIEVKDDLGRQDASDLISILFTSRKLD